MIPTNRNAKALTHVFEVLNHKLCSIATRCAYQGGADNWNHPEYLIEISCSWYIRLVGTTGHFINFNKFPNEYARVSKGVTLIKRVCEKYD